MDDTDRGPLSKRAIIIGAGPAGLTAALELLRRTGTRPVILEASEEIGGISRTVRYKGNRMDIGGHRFFSKSDRVMQWWMDLMPLEEEGDGAEIAYRGGVRRAVVPAKVEQEPPLRGMGPKVAHDAAEDEQRSEGTLVVVAETADDPDRVMLIRPRKSRIYYLRRFFDYPIKLTGPTLNNLGLVRTVRVGVSYVVAKLRQIAPETSLEDFLINRFGRELYLTFFKSYTEKVWGMPCAGISAEWGAQRIKGLSLTTALKHFVRTCLTRGAKDVAQKGTDTSLIERFLYPKLGPGQLWEHVADEIVRLGGEIHVGLKVVGVECSGKHVVGVEAEDAAGERRTFDGEYFFSTMPMKDLVRALDAPVPKNVREVSEGLEYRDFITVGLLCDRLRLNERDGGLLKDTWIYVQEPDVLLGRLQIFNNWSPHMVRDPTKVWIGLEYFCYEADELWKRDDEALKRFAIAELVKIGIVEADAVTDGHVVRVPKTYPAYFGTYDRFGELREFTDSFENLFLIGRNGMHKYNNQDHSMLTAMTVVDGLCAGHVDKAALWGINMEQEYHEEKR